WPAVPVNPCPSTTDSVPGAATATAAEASPVPGPGSGPGSRGSITTVSSEAMRGARGSLAACLGEAEANRDESTDAEMLQEAAKRMSLAAPLAERKEAPGRAGARAVQQDKVLQDGILKEKVHLQEMTRRTWERRWGFLAEQELAFRQEAAAARVDPRRVRAHPGGEQQLKRHVDDILPSPPIPRLSSGLVGWRSSQPELSLERVGALYKSPLRTIDPPEEPGDVPRGRQSFIFLGSRVFICVLKYMLRPFLPVKKEEYFITNRIDRCVKRDKRLLFANIQRWGQLLEQSERVHFHGHHLVPREPAEIHQVLPKKKAKRPGHYKRNNQST
ncbi:hypothetical protein KUF71_024678, partial [Frankliniella fusca]